MKQELVTRGKKIIWVGASWCDESNLFYCFSIEQMETDYC